LETLIFKFIHLEHKKETHLNNKNKIVICKKII